MGGGWWLVDVGVGGSMLALYKLIKSNATLSSEIRINAFECS